ncbi:MAG TPA: hypothetical protein VGA22_00420 [Gemmatimonadales bacterium]|jgi:hypothetical protein
MHLRPAVLAATLLSPPALHAQAPPTADLWLVVTTTLAVPPALEDGATATLWNPAASMAEDVAIGLAIVQPPDVLGLTAVTIGAGYEMLRGLQVTALVARIAARDLVRTTTSPTSLPGGIPVYDQMAAVGLTVTLPTVRIGSQLRYHDSRFDVLREQGLTIDVGMQLRVSDRVRLAGATHLFPINFSRQASTDYYVGGEVALLGTERSGGFGLVPRYGFTAHAEGGYDHVGGLGIRLGRPLQFDALVSRESGHGFTAWRPAFALRLRIGGYTIAATRGSGVNDVGATYRVVLDLAF